MPPRTKAARRKAPARRAAAKPSRPAIVVEDLADFNESINFLVYGDSGTGKTPFCGMAPNAVFLSTEKGTISAKRFGSKAKLIRATSWEKLEAAIDYLEGNPDGFDWVILDSLTKMQVLLMRFLLRNNVEEGKKNADIDVPQIQDHQKWQNMFKRFVDRLIDLDVNTIFIATSMHKEDAEGEDLVLPDVQGKDYAIAQYVCAQMDGVYCLKVTSDKNTGEPVWNLLTKTKPPYFAKDRFRAFPMVVKKPFMPDVIEAIQNSLAEGESLAPDVPAPDVVEPEDLDDDLLDAMEDDRLDDEEPEEPATPARQATAKKTSRTTRTSRRSQESAEEDEEEEQPKRRRPNRTTRAAPKRTGRAKIEPDDTDEEEPDDFDPDDELEDEEL